MTDLHDERLLIVDFGSQYTQLIARRVRECGVYCEIHPWDMSSAAVADYRPTGIILSGGPETVTAEVAAPEAPAAVFELGVPVLGICYGMHTMAQQLGGAVTTSAEQEFGHADIEFDPESCLLGGLAGEAGKTSVWMSHGDKVVRVPEGFTVSASSVNAPIAAMEDASRRLFAVQFHPEVTHTPCGAALLQRFCRDVCGCHGLWNPSNIIDDAIARVREQVGGDRVVLGLSGGVDSSVVAALLARAIGDQLYCVFVDNGLLRLNERAEVEAAFAPSNALQLNLVTVDASAEFLERLHDIEDPEAKRKAIGNTFIDVFEREAKKIEGARWLAQGTIYPDVIESAGSVHGKAHVIKSHHNVGGLPERMHLDLVEPLRELFKDEVRTIGRHLGLPDRLINRHPFPGPGLGVRILGAVTRDAADELRRADHIFIEELRAADLYDRVSQAFAVWLPVKSVGVVGDARRHAPVVALRAVETVDFMTARWAHLPYEFIERVSNRIINEISGISRVVYDVSSKPPATIEWE